MRKEFFFDNKDFGQQKFSLQKYKVNIYRRIDFNGPTNEVFNQKHFVSEDFDTAKKVLNRIYKEIRKEDLDVFVINHIEVKVQRKKRRVIKSLKNLLGSNKEFIEDVNKSAFIRILSERIEEALKNLEFARFLYNNKVLAIFFTQRIIAIFKDRTIPLPEKYVIWFSAYFENETT